MGDSTIYQYVKSEMKKRDNLIEKLNEKYADLVQGEFQNICDDEVGRFYADYDPISYSRKGDLFKVSKVSVNPKSKKMSVDFDYSELTGHRLGFDTFGKYMFEYGWHGGAPSCKTDDPDHPGRQPHPEKGVPYWKTSVSHYKNWFPKGSPAAMSDSIYNNIMDRLDEAGKKLMADMTNEFKKIIDNYTNNVVDAINKM